MGPGLGWDDDALRVRFGNFDNGRGCWVALVVLCTLGAEAPRRRGERERCDEKLGDEWVWGERGEM